MATGTPSFSFDFDTMVDLISSILSEVNVGLLVYHLEDADDPYALRLVYANRVASEYTRADLSELVGLPIAEAFPALKDTELPALYAEVVQTNRSRNIGAFEYKGDAKVGRGYFSVKAFPMPNDCVGILFENITVRKQLEELVKRQQRS